MSLEKSYCKYLLECTDKILVFTSFTSFALISLLIALLVIVFTKLTFIYNGKIKVKLKGNCSKQEGKVSCSYRNVVNVFTVNELDSWLRNSNKDFTLGDCLFEAVNVDLDNCEYSGYGIGFDSRCFIVKCEFGKNVIVWCW